MPAPARARRGIWLGLGANLGDPGATLGAALRALDATDGIAVLRVSPAYRTPPWGAPAQPDFVNAVCEIASTLPGPEIVSGLLAVERELGRVRDAAAPRWAPRHIDIDLLLDGSAVLDVPGCTVPHPRLTQRAFVLVPLAALAPDAAVPGHGTVADCLARLAPAERDSATPLGLLEWRRATGE